MDVCELLVAHGSDIQAANCRSALVFHEAVRNGNVDVAGLIMVNGVGVGGRCTWV